MSCVIDLSEWRRRPRSLSHPAGVTLPIEDPGHASLLAPGVRDAIGNGTHCADVIRLLATGVRAGDRVLVLGSGLGVVSSLVAKAHGVARVIAVEPNTDLAAYIDHVHGANGVPWVEVVNGVPIAGGRGRLPVFVRHDVRDSSLCVDHRPCTQVMLVPGVNLNLMLAEERISLIVAESSAVSAQLLARAQLASVERIIFTSSHAMARSREQEELTACLAERGFAGQSFGTALRFDRADAGEDVREAPRCAALASGRHAHRRNVRPQR